MSYGASFSCASKFNVERFYRNIYQELDLIWCGYQTHTSTIDYGFEESNPWASPLRLTGQIEMSTPKSWVWFICINLSKSISRDFSLPNATSRIQLCECTMLRVTPRHLGTSFETTSHSFFDLVYIQLYPPQLSDIIFLHPSCSWLDLTLHVGFYLLQCLSDSMPCHVLAPEDAYTNAGDLLDQLNKLFHTNPKSLDEKHDFGAAYARLRAVCVPGCERKPRDLRKNIQRIEDNMKKYGLCGRTQSKARGIALLGMRTLSNLDAFGISMSIVWFYTSSATRTCLPQTWKINLRMTKTWKWRIGTLR